MKIDLKKAKWLIPVLAILVVFESVLIVEKLERKTTETGKEQPEKQQEETVLSLSLSGNESVSLDSEEEVKFTATPFKDLNLIGVDLLLEYDPEYLEIVGNIPTDRFSYIARNWIEPEKKRILVSLVENEKQEGVILSAGEEINFLTLKYKALKQGGTEIRIIGEEQEGTTFAEKGTAKKIPFETKNLMINIE